MSFYIPDLVSSLTFELPSSNSQVLSFNMSEGDSACGTLEFLIKVYDSENVSNVQSVFGICRFILLISDSTPYYSVDQTIVALTVPIGTLLVSWSIDTLTSPVSLIVDIDSTGIDNAVYSISISPNIIGSPSFNIGNP
jgi:hypothetical protein